MSKQNNIKSMLQRITPKVRSNLIKIKNTLNTHSFIAYIILFCTFLIIHLLITKTGGDDTYFSSKNISDLINFTSHRYNNWSSRAIIEAVLVILLHLPRLIWCIADSVMITSIAWSISYLFTKNNLFCKILSAIVTIIFPFTIMGTAGWYATTLNYLWPLSFLLISFIPIKHIFNEFKEPVWAYPIYIISLIFACNQEQSCLLCLGFYAIFSFYFFSKKKKAKFIYIQTILAVASLFFILTCPGNSARLASEIKNWYPTFGGFNLIQKTMLGINSTFAMLVVRYNLPFIVLSILLVLYLKKSPFCVKIISTIPLVFILSYHLFSGFLQGTFPFLEKVFVTTSNFNSTPGAKIQPQSPLAILSLQDETNWILMLIALASIASICFCLYYIFRKEKCNKYFIPLILIAGVLSAIMMGFSPTIYASHNRTFTFLDCSIIIVILIICCKAERITRKTTMFFVTTMAVLQLLNTLYIITK